jgi:hypothetical protein
MALSPPFSTIMKQSQVQRSLPGSYKTLLVLCALVSAMALPLNAFQFDYRDLKGSFDTTISIGGLYRLYDPNPAYYGLTGAFNGVTGQQNSVNSDDGNLNFGKGFTSEMFKVSHDLELHYKNVGALVRGYYFYDYQVEKEWDGRTPLSDSAIDRVGKGAEWLDMYTFAKFDLAGRNIDVRFGRQVLSLGESTFIPNGINVVNPVDLSKLRMPGAELKEALLPVNMLKIAVPITENLSIEPYWLLEFRRNEIEPAGSFFSTNDFAARGGEKVMLGFGALSDLGTLGGIPRTSDREGGNYNQGGISARLQVPALNDTEFGFYFARYHSRSPVISAFTPTGPISPALVQSTASSLAQQNLAPAMIAYGIPASTVATVLPQLLGAALTNVPASALPSSLAPYSAFYPSAQSIAAGAGKVGLLTAAATGRYFVEYPEGIDMYGVSFNTNVGRTGIAWQGEVSLKQGVPLQVDDVELLFATIGALNPTFAANNQLGNFYGRYSTEVSGYRRHNVWTAQSTMTKVFGPMLGASQFTLLGEVGGVWVNLPEQSTLRYDGPATFTGGDASYMSNTGNGAYASTPARAFPDKFSWGYQMLARLEYNNLIGGINVLPTIAFTHDVSGVTPLPLGNFLEGRKSVTIGAEFVYQNNWSFDLRYVNFFGAGKYNLLSDRDYVSATVKYSF